MKKIIRLLFCSMLIALIVVACEQYDPYKNPRPTSKPRERKNPIEIPPLPSCNRRQSQPPAGSGGGGGGGFGCKRRVDTVHREPRHQREPRHREVRDPNGPVYPCPDHIFPFCTDENPYGVTYKSGTTGYAAYPRSGNLGCLTIAPGPVWYYMQIDQPGDLLIYIEQKGVFKKLDVDFACWGPFEAESKRDFLDKICNSFYSLNVEPNESHRPENGDHHNDMGKYPSGNLVDCSFDRAGTEWCYIPEAKTGEWYLLLLTNYSKKRGKIHFERVDEMSTATTNCNVVIPISITPITKGLKQIDERTSAICLYETKALVTIELETDEGYKLPRHSLRQADVEVHANGRTYRARLKNGDFECAIDINTDTTEYYATISCPDPEFDLDTRHHYIVRTTDCSSEDVEFTPGHPHYAGDESFIQLVKGDGTIEIDQTDISGSVGSSSGGNRGPNLEDYDAKVDYDELLIEQVKLEKTDQGIVLKPQLRGDWCECFVPDTLTFMLRLVPNNGDVHATPYEIPIQIGVLHRTIWIGRCLGVLVAVIISVLLAIYLILLMKKRRFKKDAMMNPVYYDRNGDEVDNHSGTLLREEGLWAWLKRWFWPRDERHVLSFDSLSMSPLTFVAADSDSIVNILKSNIDTQTMSVDGYDPNNDGPESKFVKLGNNRKICVTKSDGITPEGYVSYSSGDARDGGLFRLLLSVVFAVDIGFILILFIMMLRGLF